MVTNKCGSKLSLEKKMGVKRKFVATVSFFISCLVSGVTLERRSSCSDSFVFCTLALPSSNCLKFCHFSHLLSEAFDAECRNFENIVYCVISAGCGRF